MDTRVMTPRPVAGWRLARATARVTRTVLILVLMLISRLTPGDYVALCAKLCSGEIKRGR